MILNLVYTNRGFYVSNQAMSRLICLLDLRTIGLYIKNLCNLVNALTSTKSVIKTLILTKLTFTQEKSFSYI